MHNSVDVNNLEVELSLNWADYTSDLRIRRILDSFFSSAKNQTFTEFMKDTHSISVSRIPSGYNLKFESNAALVAFTLSL